MTETELFDKVGEATTPIILCGDELTASPVALNESELAHEPQRMLRTLGLPPHTPPELVLQALAAVRALVGQGLQLQQEALRSTPLFAWLEEHAGARLNTTSLVMTLQTVTAG